MAALQRASVSQLQLAVIEALPEGPSVLDAVPAAVLAAIRSSPRTSWLGAENMMELLRACERVGGVELSERAAFGVTTRTEDHPLFRPLVQGALRLFGSGPVPLFKVLPRAWKISNRDSGVLEVETAPSDAKVHVHDLAPELDCDEWKRSWRGTARGMLSLAKVQGDAIVTLEPGGFRVDVHWTG